MKETSMMQSASSVLLAACFMLFSFFPYSSTLKTEFFVLLPVFSFGVLIDMYSMNIQSSVRCYSLITTVNPFIH
jgi:hypothetical protein